MAPLVLAHMLIILACLTIGKISLRDRTSWISITEKESSLVTRVTTFLIALVGLYPQYRAIRTVLIGKGWIDGDWERDHKYNNRNLYVIEPLVESLLQVTQDLSYQVICHRLISGFCSIHNSLHLKRPRWRPYWYFISSVWPFLSSF